MRKFLFVLCLIALITGCGSSIEWDKEREKPNAISLLEEIKDRSDVSAVVISDVGGLCVAMIGISKEKAEITATYFLGRAKKMNVPIKYCKIISAYDCKTDNKTYMSGTKLAFENQE